MSQHFASYLFLKKIKKEKKKKTKEKMFKWRFGRMVFQRLDKLTMSRGYKPIKVYVIEEVYQYKISR